MKKNIKCCIFPLFFLPLFFSSCLKEDKLTRSFESFKPVDINDRWELSTPGAENIDSMTLVQVFRDLYAHEKSWTLKSMSVFRNGKLVAESYLKSDEDRCRQNAIWSCTKQVAALITGIAIEEGYIGSVLDSIYMYLPETDAHQDKKNITVKNMLMMQSGIFFDNDVESDVFRKHLTNNSVDYVLGNELKWQPGTYFQYNDGTPQLVSAVIQNTTGMTMAEYADRKMFSKIGLTNYEWKQYSDDVTMGGFGLMMPPRELAKIAQCVCDSGKWSGQQVIPKNWITDVLNVKVPELFDDIGFGYFWWVNPAEGYVYMWGHGGQYVIIYPGKRLVIAITGLEQIEDDAVFWYKDALGFAKRINACSY